MIAQRFRAVTKPGAGVQLGTDHVGSAWQLSKVDAMAGRVNPDNLSGKFLCPRQRDDFRNGLFSGG